VALPLTDVLTGLQTGLVDTVASSTIGAIRAAVAHPGHAPRRSPARVLTGGLVIDQKAFGQLSAADQQVVGEVLQASNRPSSTARTGADSEAGAAHASIQQGIQSPGIGRRSATLGADRGAAMDSLAAQGRVRWRMPGPCRRHLEAIPAGRSRGRQSRVAPRRACWNGWKTARLVFCCRSWSLLAAARS